MLQVLINKYFEYTKELQKTLPLVIIFALLRFDPHIHLNEQFVNGIYRGEMQNGKEHGETISR